MFENVLNKKGKALMPCKPRKSKKLKLLESIKCWLINMEDGNSSTTCTGRGILAK